MPYNYNIQDSKDTVRSRIKTKLRELYPEIDFSQDTSYDDMIVEPLTSIMADAYGKLSAIEQTAGLESAQNMTEDQLDTFCEGNYWMARIRGKKASTTLTLSFSNLESNGQSTDVIVPAGTIFANGRGFQYQTTYRTVIPKATFYKYFNQKTSKYDIQIIVEAILDGASFNTDYRTITSVQSVFDNRLVSVTNNQAVTNGTNTETNIEYADRVRKYYYARQLGTAPGYEEYIKEVAPSTGAVVVSGYGHENMVRDIVILRNSRKIPIESVNYDNQTITIGEALTLPATVATATGPKSYITILGLTEYRYEVNSQNFVSSAGKTTISFANSALKPNRYWDTIIYNAASDLDYVHIGGKVDIYMSDTETGQSETSMVFMSPHLVFSKNFAEVTKSEFTVQITYMNKARILTVKTLTASDFELLNVTAEYFDIPMYQGRALIRIGDTALMDAVNASISGDFSVEVTWEQGSSEIVKYYSVGARDFTLDAPFAEDILWNNIITIMSESVGEIFLYDDDSANSNGITKGIHATISQSGNKRTSNEINVLRILPNLKKKLPNSGSDEGSDIEKGGQTLTIKHKTDVSVKIVSQTVNSPQKRSLCADVNVIACPEVYVDISLNVRLNEMATVRSEFIRNQIKSSIRRYFQDFKIGSSLTDSDFLGKLYSDKTVYPYIAYVDKPLNSSTSIFNIIENIVEEHDSEGNVTSRTIHYRQRKDTDGLDNNTDALPIFSVEKPVVYEPTFKINFI